MCISLIEGKSPSRSEHLCGKTATIGKSFGRFFQLWVRGETARREVAHNHAPDSSRIDGLRVNLS